MHEKGAVHAIESALDEAGEHPAAAFINCLRASKKPSDRDMVDDLAVRLYSFATTGELEVPRELNELKYGLWEIKAGRLRTPFFYLQDEHVDVRLTHCFIKGTKPTPLGEIDRAKAIRREDGAR